MKDQTDKEIRSHELQPYKMAELPSTYLADLHHGRHDADDVHLRDYLNVILRRKTVFIIFLVSAIVLTMAISFLMTPLYQATAVIKIDTRDPNVLSIPGLPSKEGSNFYQTQYEILKSRSLAEKVIKNLELANNKDFLLPKDIFSKMKSALVTPVIDASSRIFAAFSPDSIKEEEGSNAQAPASKEEIPAYLSYSLISRLEVTPVKDSQLVKVSFTSQKPKLAMSVTNAIADGYIEYDLESRVDSSKQARVFLEDQIQKSKEKVVDVCARKIPLGHY